MGLLRRVVRVVQAGTLLVTASFAILLFTNEPQEPPALPDPGAAGGGAAIFVTRCAGCHGDDGEGGFGPALRSDVVTGRFPDAQDQVRVVANGRGAMPSFAGSLTPEQIAAVVEYTRTERG